MPGQQQNGPSTCVVVTHVGSLDEAPGFWFWPGRGPALGYLGNEQANRISLYLYHSLFQIKEKKCFPHRN